MLHLRRSRGYLHSNLLLEWGEVNVGTISVVLAPITFVAEKVSMMPCFRTLLTMALAGVLGSLWGCGKSAPEQAAKSPEELLQIVILNADEYRQEITDIDRLVFDEKPFDKDRRALLATKLGELAARVKAAKDSHFLEIEAYEITRLADGFKNMPEQPLRSQLPNQWMRIRNNLFDDRSWFARSAADFEAAPGGSQ